MGTDTVPIWHPDADHVRRRILTTVGAHVLSPDHTRYNCPDHTDARALLPLRTP